MQKAILCFRDYLDKDLISGITQGQNEGTHQNLNGANDYNGRSAQDQVDLLAPYDCKVMSIASYDNAVFFESLEPVETPTGISKCWFLCCHMNDNDYKRYGMKVGKVFKQGEACYTEGNKGIGSGYHIHMEQGTGEFDGANAPYYKSNDTYYYGGKKYYTYYPHYKNGWEMPVYDAFFLKDTEIVLSQHEKDMGHKYYEGKWHVENETQKPQNNENTEGIQLMQETINALVEQNNELTERNNELMNKIESVREKLKELTEAMI